MRASGVPVVAISRIVNGTPLDHAEEGRARSRTALLASAGHGPTPAAVAGLYRGLVDRFVLDDADADRSTRCALPEPSR